MQKKLLFIVNVDWFFVSHRLPIAIKAIEMGYDVHLACGVTTMLDKLTLEGIVVHPLALSRSGTSLLGELKILADLFKIIKNVNPDIVHSVTIKPVLYGNIVAQLLNVPLRVASISGLGYVFITSGIKSKIFRSFIAAMYRVALTGAEAVIFQNKSDRDVLMLMGGVSSEQTVFVRGSGVELDQYAVVDEPRDSSVVILVARLLIDKGVNEFVSAAKILKSKRPDIRMVLVGEVDLANPKSIEIAQLSSWIEDGVVEHWGYCENIAKTMAKANIVVLPSYREGLPKSLIEAAACGRAVITTDVPGCRDAIEPNRTGLLVPVKAVEPLVAAILKLIDDVELRRRFSLRARQFAEENFNINDVVDKHLAIYNRQ